MDGIIVINKEKGFTSNDVVQVLRGILRMKKIGHTGTLDPDAEGVLPVCLGKGTKLVNMLTDRDKEYIAEARLGISTDTEDMSGKVIKRFDIPEGKEPSEEALKEALSSFIGGYDQIPPMYSAKKVNGRKLYDLAREGQVVERKPCRVEIHDISLESYDFPVFRFSVRCGKGTYIRSLIRDTGEKLGMGAAMESLIRTEASGFKLDEALTLKEVEELMARGEAESHIINPDRVFADLPSITAEGRNEGFVRNGNPFSLPGITDGDYRVYLPDGEFAAVYSFSRGKAGLKRMFL